MTPYIWMPPEHKQHKENMLCQLRGCPYAPIHLDAPCKFRCYHIFGCLPLYVWIPLYVWTPPYVWMPTCMFGHPNVWIPPVCLGAPYVWTPLCMVRCPNMFGHPPYVWMSSICVGVSKHTGGIQT